MEFQGLFEASQFVADHAQLGVALAVGVNDLVRQSNQHGQLAAEVVMVYGHDMVRHRAHRRARPIDPGGLGAPGVAQREFSEDVIEVEPLLPARLVERRLPATAVVDPEAE